MKTLHILITVAICVCISLSKQVRESDKDTFLGEYFSKANAFMLSINPRQKYGLINSVITKIKKKIPEDQKNIDFFKKLPEIYNITVNERKNIMLYFYIALVVAILSFIVAVITCLGRFFNTCFKSPSHEEYSVIIKYNFIIIFSISIGLLIKTLTMLFLNKMFFEEILFSKEPSSIFPKQIKNINIMEMYVKKIADKKKFAKLIDDLDPLLNSSMSSAFDDMLDNMINETMTSGFVDTSIGKKINTIKKDIKDTHKKSSITIDEFKVMENDIVEMLSSIKENMDITLNSIANKKSKFDLDIDFGEVRSNLNILDTNINMSSKFDKLDDIKDKIEIFETFKIPELNAKTIGDNMKKLAKPQERISDVLSTFNASKQNINSILDSSFDMLNNIFNFTNMRNTVKDFNKLLQKDEHLYVMPMMIIGSIQLAIIISFVFGLCFSVLANKSSSFLMMISIYATLLISTMLCVLGASTYFGGIILKTEVCRYIENPADEDLTSEIDKVMNTLDRSAYILEKKISISSILSKCLNNSSILEAMDLNINDNMEEKMQNMTGGFDSIIGNVKSKLGNQMKTLNLLDDSTKTSLEDIGNNNTFDISSYDDKTIFEKVRKEIDALFPTIDSLIQSLEMIPDESGLDLMSDINNLHNASNTLKLLSEDNLVNLENKINELTTTLGIFSSKSPKNPFNRIQKIVDSISELSDYITSNSTITRFSDIVESTLKNKIKETKSELIGKLSKLINPECHTPVNLFQNVLDDFCGNALDSYNSTWYQITWFVIYSWITMISGFWICHMYMYSPSIINDTFKEQNEFLINRSSILGDVRQQQCANVIIPSQGFIEQDLDYKIIPM